MEISYSPYILYRKVWVQGACVCVLLSILKYAADHDLQLYASSTDSLPHLFQILFLNFLKKKKCLKKYFRLRFSYFNF